MAFTLEQLAEFIDARIEGQSDCKITAINTLQDSGEGDISFLSNRRYSKYLANAGASAVILKDEDLADCPTNALVVDDPYIAYAKIANLIYVNNNLHHEISSTAIIGNHCQIAGTVFIGANVVVGNHVEIDNECYIGPGCVIGDNVSIKAGTRLSANITLCNDVSIGQNVIMHPGVVIGADGFGIARDKEGWIKIPQIGSVIIGDNVEIGANTTIDRGAIGDTVIEKGVKIDNQVQIGHNVHVGEHTAIAGCTGIAGSATIGKRCMIGGAAAINGHIQIVDDVIITAMSGVPNSIKEPGVYSSGLPVTDNRTWRKNIIRFKHLDTIAKKINKLDM